MSVPDRRAILDRADRTLSIRRQCALVGVCAFQRLPAAAAGQRQRRRAKRVLKYPLDKHLYAQRHLVECCFSKLKQFRRVATRFEKTARNYRTVVTLAYRPMDAISVHAA